MGFSILWILALDGGVWPPLCPRHFTIGLNPIPFDRRLDVAQGQSRLRQQSTSNLLLSNPVTMQTDVPYSSGKSTHHHPRVLQTPALVLALAFKSYSSDTHTHTHPTNFKMNMMVTNKWNLIKMILTGKIISY